jgi:hypothetical protein
MSITIPTQLLSDIPSFSSANQIKPSKIQNMNLSDSEGKNLQQELPNTQACHCSQNNKKIRNPQTPHAIVPPPPSNPLRWMESFTRPRQHYQTPKPTNTPLQHPNIQQNQPTNPTYHLIQEKKHTFSHFQTQGRVFSNQGRMMRYKKFIVSY